MLKSYWAFVFFVAKCVSISYALRSGRVNFSIPKMNALILVCPLHLFAKVIQWVLLI